MLDSAVGQPFAIYDVPFGSLLIEHRGGKLCRLQILESAQSDLGSADDFTDRVFCQVMEYLRGERSTFDLELDLSGVTEFQQKVYSALLTIPYGQVLSYKDVAQKIGNPKASRAVGQANNRNPIHIIIPCHRVIGSRGAITGYAAGVAAKEFLLDLERENAKTCSSATSL